MSEVTQLAERDRLEGLRCPHCRAALATNEAGHACPGCARRYDVGPHPGVLSVGATAATFAEGLDAHLLGEVIPALEQHAGERPAERVLIAEAVRLGLYLGNPVLEGRADVARLLPESRGIVLDVGCGLGTFTTALGRGARHVFALDQSPVRAATTAARAAAEGLDNVTAIHADGRTLPVADASCDLVTVIGVMEWTGVGERDPLAAQGRLLAEVARVLRPGGVLLLGIENRFGGHYLAGKREEHLGLPFVSLLPRPLAGVYTRLGARRRFDVLTHSDRALLALARGAGLSGRLAFPLPGYQNPQINFDAAELRFGLRLYARHVLRITSPARRVLAHVVARAPAVPSRHMLPAFWLVAAKGPAPPPPIPTTVTGNGFAAAAMKVVDPGRGVLRRIARSDGTVVEEPLIDGFNARAWLNWPLTTRRRRARERPLLAWLAGLADDRRPASAGEVTRAREEASDGIAFLRVSKAAAPTQSRSSFTDVHALRVQTVAPLAPEAADWCRARLDAAALADLPAVAEHGDLVLTNVVVDARGRLAAIDEAAGQPEHGLVGRDVVLLLLDVLSSRRGHSGPELSAALDELAALPETDLTPFAGALRALDAALDPDRLEEVVVLSVLRHCGTKGDLPGAARLIERAAAGDLRAALRRVAAAAT